MLAYRYNSMLISAFDDRITTHIILLYCRPFNSSVFFPHCALDCVNTSKKNLTILTHTFLTHIAHTGRIANQWQTEIDTTLHARQYHIDYATAMTQALHDFGGRQTEAITGRRHGWRDPYHNSVPPAWPTVSWLNTPQSHFIMHIIML